MYLNFEKDFTGWYIVLPNWIGPKSALAMVAGADTLLDQLSKGSPTVTIELHLEPQDDSFLHVSKVRRCWFNGADYIVSSIGHKLWLCNVTLFVLGEFPQDLYIKVCA